MLISALILRFTVTSISNRFQFLFWFDLEFTTALEPFLMILRWLVFQIKEGQGRPTPPNFQEFIRIGLCATFFKFKNWVLFVPKLFQNRFFLSNRTLYATPFKVEKFNEIWHVDSICIYVDAVLKDIFVI